MDKNWLIRTKSCHILGPVSREKVIELLQNGSIKPEDEICSGNGYWIWLRETDLVDRFLMQGEQQDFNPICEAPTVFGEIPKPSQYEDDITLIGRRPDLSSLRSEEPAAPSSTMAKVGERTAELLKPTKPPVKREYIPSPPPVTPGKSTPRRRAEEPRPVVVLRPRGAVSDRAFMIGALLALFALAAIFYYRKRIITEFIQSAVSTVLPSAIAQDEGAKKKISSLKS